MKIGVIIFNNISKCPYVNPYISILVENNIKYDILCLERQMDDNYHKNYIPIHWKKNRSKVYNFRNFRKEIIPILNVNKYDKLIVLTTMPAIILFDYLILKYKNKFIVDIRDYTYEKIKLYYFIEKMIIKYSYQCIISSPYYKNFLPKSNYLQCHNINEKYLPHKYNLIKKNDEPILIGYVGTVGYIEQCKKLINLVKNDSRFAFEFYGDEVVKETIFPYIDSIRCDRIKYFGKYIPADKDRIINHIDLLFNAYGNGNLLVDTALSNKLYDSCYFKKPLLTSPNTAMSQITGEFSFSTDLIDESTLDCLYKWYSKIDPIKFDKYADIFIEEVIEEQKKFKKLIIRFFLEED